MVLRHCAIADTCHRVSHHRQCEEASYASCAGTPCYCKLSFTCQWTTNIVPVTVLPSSRTKQSNFEDFLFSLPGRAAQTWLAQKALRGMKVATPSFNWIPLSSTFGHGVSVLASGRLPLVSHAPPRHRAQRVHQHRALPLPGVPCARMFPPFLIGCAAGLCLTGLWSVRGWTLMCCSEARWFFHCGASGSEGHREVLMWVQMFAGAVRRVCDNHGNLLVAVREIAETWKQSAATGILNGLALGYLSNIFPVVGLDITFLIAYLCVARSVRHWEPWACLAHWRRADRSPIIFTCGI